MTSDFPTLSEHEELLFLKQAIAKLHRDYINLMERGKPCDHLTIRTPYLPCAHPDCYALPPGNPYLKIVRAPEPDFKWTTEANRVTTEETWQRRTLVIPPSVKIYGWSRIS